MRLIEIEDASVEFGRTPILNDVTWRLESGEVVWLQGPNGAGKSTLLRLLAGLISPHRGVVRHFCVAPNPATRRRIGLIAHRPALYDDLTLGENLAFIADIASVDASRVEEALDQVGLLQAKGRSVRAASEGMRRRLDLARLLLFDHDVLLLDEARSGLDEEAAGLVEAIVERCIEGGGAAVVVAHSDAPTFANATANIKDGRVI